MRVGYALKRLGDWQARESVRSFDAAEACFTRASRTADRLLARYF